ncbi:MAG: M23 family metallopeptidase, partial [Fimbriimonadaceae bacterium]|nr:M23 family metallopeptidase [Fimbriimonadaceae bacterium]
RNPRIEIVFPVLGGRLRRDTFNQHRGRYRHTGQDIPARKMTPILAPFSGRINMKVESFWIYSDDGIRCLGTHLNDDTPGTNDGQGGRDFMFAPNLRPGDRVVAGQFIGYLGDSGNATGPHLHFELHDSRGVLNPLRSLLGAVRLSRPTRVIQNVSWFPEEGQERFDLCIRVWDPESRMLRGILVARQKPSGGWSMETRPTYAWIQIPTDVDMVNGTLDGFPQDRVVSVYFRRMEGRLVAQRVVLSDPA